MCFLAPDCSQIPGTFLLVHILYAASLYTDVHEGAFK